MQSHARVVVVGGGCIGVNILNELARRGWNDAVLLERRQLTAGSTWHAAGLIPIYSFSYRFGRLIAKSIEIYEGLEAETGHPVGWHQCGQLRVANSRERMDEYLNYAQHRRDPGGAGRDPLAAGSARALAPLRRPSRHSRRSLQPRRRPHRARRCHPGRGGRRARQGREDPPGGRASPPSRRCPAGSGGYAPTGETSSASMSSSPPAATRARPARWWAWTSPPSPSCTSTG